MQFEVLCKLNQINAYNIKKIATALFSINDAKVHLQHIEVCSSMATVSDLLSDIMG